MLLSLMEGTLEFYKAWYVHVVMPKLHCCVVKFVQLIKGFRPTGTQALPYSRYLQSYEGLLAFLYLVVGSL